MMSLPFSRNSLSSLDPLSAPKTTPSTFDKDLTVPLNWSSKLVLSVTIIILSKIRLLSSFDLYREVRR